MSGLRHCGSGPCCRQRQEKRVVFASTFGSKQLGGLVLGRAFAADEIDNRPRLRPRSKRRQSSGNWLSSLGRFLLITLAIVSMRPALLGYTLGRMSQEEPEDSETGSFLRTFLKVLVITILVIVLVPVVLVLMVVLLLWLNLPH